MAPQYRSVTQTRRGYYYRGGHAERDDFEGLPIRQWRQEWQNITRPPPPPYRTPKPDRFAAELPHAMPKEWPLLPPHSQQLLRAARSGILSRRPGATAGDEEVKAEDGPAAKTDGKRAAPPSRSGVVVKAWRRLARAVEGPDISRLAKRPKNIVTLPSKAELEQKAEFVLATVTVRRVDDAGNTYEETIKAPGRDTEIDGEIIATTEIPVMPIPSARPASPPPPPVPALKKTAPPRRKARRIGRARSRTARLPLPDTSAPRVMDERDGGRETGHVATVIPEITLDVPNSDGGEAAVVIGQHLAPDVEMGGVREDGMAGLRVPGPELGPDSARAPRPEVAKPRRRGANRSPRPRGTPIGAKRARLAAPRASLQTALSVHGMHGSSPLRNVIVPSPTEVSPLPAAPSGMGIYTSAPAAEVSETAFGAATTSLAQAEDEPMADAPVASEDVADGQADGQTDVQTDVQAENERMLDAQVTGEDSAGAQAASDAMVDIQTASEVVVDSVDMPSTSEAVVNAPTTNEAMGDSPDMPTAGELAVDAPTASEAMVDAPVAIETMADSPDVLATSEAAADTQTANLTVVDSPDVPATGEAMADASVASETVVDAPTASVAQVEVPAPGARG